MSNADLPLLDPKEFLDEGYLLEVNRRVLHPLGLAMAVNVNEETGQVTIHGIYDNREDPEGWYIGVGLGDEDYDADIEAKVRNIRRKEESRHVPRLAALGYWVQPYEELDKGEQA